MKKFAFLALFLSLGLFTVGCKPTEKKPPTPAGAMDSKPPGDKMPAEDTKPADDKKPAEEPK